MTKTPLLAVLALAALSATPAASQSAEQFVDAFSGAWYSFDAARASGTEPCRIELEAGADDLQRGHAAASAGCAAPLSELARWDIENGQLHLMNETGGSIALLGGNQVRVTGDVVGEAGTLILDRSEGAPEAAALSAALRKHRCIYRGYSQDCAPKEELHQPEMIEEGGTYANVEVLVQLNVRGQPRGDAGALGVLEPGSCLKVNYCATASDGIWCRAQFGEQSGWVKKTSLRQSEWPVLTFANSCPHDEG
ncbi:AprI/Inh family metalloprotease inhibitor [Salipiger sp. H15]|uniref:AprI/Inh family metalloprotease inhibitor n=1 Tax=Alloyangia sp. H15 TaxID=3029062 RepID=A0AAU8ANA4_9RHOB